MRAMTVLPRTHCTKNSDTKSWLKFIFIAGGYEHTCKVWDVRSRAATMTLDHGAPIEALSYFPSGEPM